MAASLGSHAASRVDCVTLCLPFEPVPVVRIESAVRLSHPVLATCFSHSNGRLPGLNDVNEPQ